nr:hypothetical protein [Sphaerisporangium cinnabarinum]
MRLEDRVSVSGAYVVAPVATALAVWFLLVNEIPGDPRAITVGASGAWPVVLVAPVVAASAAIAGSRLRRSGGILGPRGRALVVVVGEQVWPLVVAGTVALGTGTVVAGAKLSYSGVPNLVPLLPAVAMIVAAAVTGFALGLRVWTPVAAALSGAVWFYLLAFPAALDPPWLRHLVETGACCTVSESLDVRAPLASLVTASALVMLGIVAIMAHESRVAVGGGLAGAVGLLALAVLLALPLGWSSTTVREGPLECTTSQSVEFCVWPEQAGDLARVADNGASAIAAVSRVTGVEPPLRLTAHSRAAQNAGERAFWFAAGSDDESLVRQTTSAAFPDAGQCFDERPAGASQDLGPLVDAQWLGSLWWQARGLTAHLASTDSESRSQPELAVPDEVVELVAGGIQENRVALTGLLELGTAEQAQWIREASRAVLACSVSAAPPLPSGTA